MSVSTIMVRVLADAVERAGVPREELLLPLGIDPARLTEVEGRFEPEVFAGLQVRAMDLTGDEALGLHMAERTHDSAFDLIAHVVSHAPTLREALGLCAQFQRLLMDHGHMTVRETPTTAALVFSSPRSLERADRLQAEFVVGGLLRLARVIAGPSATPRIVAFEHARPAHHPEYARIFGDVARFGQPETSLTFNRDALDRVQIHQHPELYSLLRSEAERALERVTDGLRPADQVRQYLLSRPPARIPDLATAARDLGVSSRSLRRRLAAEGTSYRELVRETLETSADHMLRDPKRSIQETAVTLGFSNAGAFHRAFKRWTGMTPTEYRDRGAPPRRTDS